eukprot:gene62768-85846_t
MQRIHKFASSPRRDDMADADRIAKLEHSVENLSRRLQQREDELDIRKLQYLYGYLIDKCLYNETVDLFTDDGEVCFFGGVWRGKEGIRRLYVERFQKRFTHGTNGPIDGFLLDHPQLQDIIDVEPNGVIAHARARSMMQAGRHKDFADPTNPMLGQRARSSFSTRAVVDLPTATEPAMPMMN